MNANTIKQAFPNSLIKLNEPLSNYTYTETGGPADVLIFPREKEEAVSLVSWIHGQGWPLTVLGNASNLIVKDGGIRGVVLILTKMDKVRVEKDIIFAEGGSAIIDVSRRAHAESLSGLEFACGIPGSTGGAIYMNAGAYEGEVRNVVTSIEVMTRAGEVKVLQNDDLDFSYRHSILQETGDIVLEVTFQLEQEDQTAIKERMDELTYLRTSKQPLEYPSCGSVFKRPTGYFTGKLVQEAGLQGLKWGGAQISMKHAGFIVNIDQATATDYIELIHHIQKVILEKDGVVLETEVHIIGEEPINVAQIERNIPIG